MKFTRVSEAAPLYPINMKIYGHILRGMEANINLNFAQKFTIWTCTLFKLSIKIDIVAVKCFVCVI